MRAKSVLVVACLCVMAMMVGCAAPRVAVKYKFPPKYDIPKNIKKVAVMPIKDYRGNRGPKRGSGSKIRNILADKLRSARDLDGTQFYKIISRDDALKSVIQEKEFQQSDWVAASKAASQQLSSVDAFIWGEITDYKTKAWSEMRKVPVTKYRIKRVKRGGRWTTESVAYTVYENRTYYFRQANFGATFRMIAVGSGEELAQKSTPKPLSVEGFNVKISADQLLEQAIEASVEDFRQYIAPYFHTYSIPIDTGGGANAVKFLKNGIWDMAQQAFEAELQKNPQNAAAMYDLAIALMAQGKVDLAEETVKKAMLINNRDMYSRLITEYIADIRNRMKTQ